MRSNVHPLGLTFFGLYLLAYGGFVALNAFWPDVMRTPVYQGVNLAIVYGMGLIVGAFFFAMLYAVLAGNESRHRE